MEAFPAKRHEEMCTGKNSKGVKSQNGKYLTTLKHRSYSILINSILIKTLFPLKARIARNLTLIRWDFSRISFSGESN